MQCLPKLQMVLMLCSPHLKEGYAKGSSDRCPKILIFKQYRCLKKQVVCTSKHEALLSFLFIFSFKPDTKQVILNSSVR